MTDTSASMSFDRLADGIWMRHGKGSGLSYQRRAQHTSKQKARNSLLSLFSRGSWPESLDILTMPSLDWSFERSLIAQRESGMGRIKPRRTRITAVEASREIWAASVTQMPGGSESLVGSLAVPAFARGVVRTHAIDRFYCCTFEDFVAEAASAWRPDWRFGGAWIDLCGPITMPRLEAISDLWKRTTRHLVITSLRARWPREVSTLLSEAGGIAELLMEVLPNGVAHSEFLYMDSSPMHQVVITRVAKDSEPERCHCGRTVHTYEDGFTRGLCEPCSAYRCDVTASCPALEGSSTSETTLTGPPIAGNAGYRKDAGGHDE